MEEQEAITRLKQDDIDGLETLVRRYQVQAVRTAYLITRDRALAEDIVQAAFLRAYERIDQFDAGRPFGPWFLRSVANDAVKSVTRGKPQISLETGTGEEEASLADFLVDPNPGPDETTEAVETRQMVWDALGRLPPAQRAAIVLRYYLDMSEAEMVEQLNCPSGTVKWRLHAARQRLRRLLCPPWSANSGSGR
jgi:RNA polymerase sigma-70 factor (ECF subfamily)